MSPSSCHSHPHHPGPRAEIVLRVVPRVIRSPVCISDHTTACGLLGGDPAGPGQPSLLPLQTLLFCALPGSLSQVVAALWPEHRSLHSRLGVHATPWVSTKLDSHL